MRTFLAEQIRDCAEHPDAEHLQQLRALAVQVERLEQVLDQQVGQAVVDAQHGEVWASSLQRWIR